MMTSQNELFKINAHTCAVKIVHDIGHYCLPDRDAHARVGRGVTRGVHARQVVVGLKHEAVLALHVHFGVHVRRVSLQDCDDV